MRTVKYRMARNKCSELRKRSGLLFFIRYLVNSFLTKGLNQINTILVHSEINKS